jgi:hypothetical protein
MSYTYKNNLKRYRCVVNLNGEQLTFKRYGTDPEVVKRELITFIHEMYEIWGDVQSVEEDKTHPIDNEE